jgi:hypothetical protein
MAFIINAFPVANYQYLWRFMLYPEGLGYPIGDRPVIQEVQVIEFDVLVCSLGSSFQPAFYQGTGGTAGAVLEYHLGAFGRPPADLF